MANRKISDLTALTAPATGDLLPIVDISEAAAANKNKKITIGELFASIPAGTAAAPSVAFEGDANTGIYSPGADQVAISTNGTGRLFVDASGNVAIAQAPSNAASFTRSFNISAENASIALRGSSGGSYTNHGIFFAVDGTNYAQIYNDGIGQLIFRTGSGLSERVRIDSSGRLLVGTSTALAVASGFSNTVQQLVGNDPMAMLRYSADVSPPTIWINKSRSATFGTQTVLQDTDGLGRFNFGGSDGTNFITAARIDAAVDGTPGTNDMPGRLVFATTADGASSPTEALRITNDRVIAYNQPTPTSKSAAATLTITELKTRIIEYTGAVATLTLPTGTLMEGGFSGIYTNMAFEWSVINTGAGICTIGAGTAHTIVGSATVAISASARFVSRRTAGNTFVSYRLS